MRMTRDEIINEIKNILSELDNGEDAVAYLTQNDVKWLNENIKALEQEPCEDVISRQAAIDALHTWFRDGFDEDKWWNSTHVLAAIEGLPSVQQEHKWETCFECPLSHGCPKIRGCTNEQAIDYASQIPNDCPLSVQPESKTGHWIIIDDCELFMAKCSECGEIVDSRMISNYPYCHCGAKMVEPQESEE